MKCTCHNNLIMCLATPTIEGAGILCVDSSKAINCGMWQKQLSAASKIDTILWDSLRSSAKLISKGRLINAFSKNR